MAKERKRHNYPKPKDNERSGRADEGKMLSEQWYHLTTVNDGTGVG